MSTAYDPKLVEEKWYAFWEEGGYFRADPKSEKEPFCIVIPPPNVTGALHMGHALVDTIQDVLIRWKRMQGFEVLWVPGTDHAGIATQSVVEKKLYIETGKRRADFSREEFLSHVWNWKEQCEGKILSQLKKLGCSCDWSRLRFTMDEGNNRAVRTVFKKMFDEGLIYQGDYLVNWDPVAGTALSDDEVEHEERPSFLWHIRYPLDEGEGSVVIATTRPETMLGDTAVAVHPSDERYKALIGRRIRHPLTERTIPIIGDPFVDPKFGSGAVKITPAHDFNDFEMAKRHQLPYLNILTPDARINEQGGNFAGLSVEEARIAVVHELKKQGFLVKVDPHFLRVPLSYRSKAVIQPYLSLQWFVKMSAFKEKLISAVREKRVNLIPSYWEETYFHWIENLRDWCISRQLWWGHRIPIWYGEGGEILCWDGEGEPAEVEKEPSKWRQDKDVLDTWFSSGLWPFAALGWPAKSDELKKFYPTSVLVTGHDILFFWVARMILMGEYVMKEVPFRDTFLHGLIYGKSYWKESGGSLTYITGEEKAKYDFGAPLPPGVESKWEKMSKTKGNIIDPLEIIETFGTDALRFSLCSSLTHARQIDLDRRRFEEYKNFANKIWNGARFVFLNLEGFEIESGIDRTLLTLEDRWILSVLNRTILEMNSCFSNYTFDRAATRAYEFFWNDFCAIYLETAKPVLFGRTGGAELKANKQKILTLVLLSAIRLLHPIAPFITEEIFSLLKNAFPNLPKDSDDPYLQDMALSLSASACMVAPYPRVLVDSDIDGEVEETFTSMNELVRLIRNIRTEMQIPPSEKTELYLSGSKQSIAHAHQALILSLTPTSQVIFSANEPALFGSSALWGGLKLTIPIPASLKGKEKGRLEKEREKLEKMKEGCELKLANPEFRARAPQEIIQKLEENRSQIERQLRDIHEKLENL